MHRPARGRERSGDSPAYPPWSASLSPPSPLVPMQSSEELEEIERVEVGPTNGLTIFFEIMGGSHIFYLIF